MFSTRHVYFNQLINYLLTGYQVCTGNTKPSVTSHGPHYVRSVPCDFRLSIFQFIVVLPLFLRSTTDIICFVLDLFCFKLSQKQAKVRKFNSLQFSKVQHGTHLTLVMYSVTIIL